MSLPKTTRMRDKKALRDKLYVIIFGTDTPAGKRFDVILLWLIVLSTAVVMLESVKEIHDTFGHTFIIIEWTLTALFTIEYALRLWIARKPLGYATSFYGIIDLLSILPSYLAFVFASSQYLIIIRIFRLMRVFRIFKISRFTTVSDSLWKSLKASRPKISIFLFAVVNVAVITGAIMYIVEGGENGFTSIPRSIYWAVVTMTTVGFGDIHPHTALGQFIAMLLMILGYGIIAVPTGIVGIEMYKRNEPGSSSLLPKLTNSHCFNCGRTGHLDDAEFCHRCGSALDV